MANINDLASWMLGNERVERAHHTSTNVVTTMYGTALSDSINGTVTVYIGEHVTNAPGISGTSVTLPTSPHVKKGDTVIISLVGSGSAKHAYVSAVVGSGDMTHDTAASAEHMAAEATSSAENAAAAAEKAKTKALEASASASEAKTKASEAVASATEASTSASEAKAKATEATASASEAKTKAEAATKSAEAANTKAEEATASAAEASKKAGEAISSASGAASAAQTAQDAAEAVEEQLSNKNRTFYAPTAPSSTSDYTLIDGDRWVDTDDLTEYIWSSSKWNRINDTHTYFWHDKNGAHVRNQDKGYQVNVGSDGVEVQRLSDGEILARYSGSGIGYSEDVPYRIGSSSSYIEYDPKTKQLTISADSVLIGDSTVSSVVNKASSDAAAALAETKDLVTLRIDSSRGTVFKNSAVSTVLTVRCYKRGQEITTLGSLKQAMLDSTARIRWYVLREGDADWVSLADSDHMISNDGFTLTVTPDDVTVKCTFKAEIVTD